MEAYFKIKTPLGAEIRVTKDYWNYLITKKHPVMHGKEEIVIETLRDPDEIRRSIIDHSIFLYYKRHERLYCAVARHINGNGFLITAYPTDKVKEGETVWTK
jgi:hypothetical protein